MTMAAHRLVLTVDVEEWYHSGRWLNDQQAQALPDTDALRRKLYGSERPTGEVIGPTRTLLGLFERAGVRCTFFILGDVARFHPELVAEIAERGHEIACHGMHHVDMTVLGPERFAEQLAENAELLRGITGRKPIGYRGPNLVFAPWATRILEDQGFVYDSTVCVSRPLGGKYKGWAKAPLHPYRPSYADVAEMGGARLVELPLPSFPVLKLAAGSAITTRIFGLHWALTALRHARRRGTTSYYLHPWEISPMPRREGPWLKSLVFQRHTGTWMLRALERIMALFPGRIVTGREAAATCTAPDWAYALSAEAARGHAPLTT